MWKRRFSTSVALGAGTLLFQARPIQDTAYQSLLKSTRQQHHQQIAQVLEEHFPDIKANQPELLAHHDTEANLIEQAIPYWQRAGQRAVQRSAHAEAVSHLTRGLEWLMTLPHSRERNQQELAFLIALGVLLQITKGWAAPEAQRIYTRALELREQVDDTPQGFRVIHGLFGLYFIRGELQTARELAERLFSLALKRQEQVLLLEAH